LQKTLHLLLAGRQNASPHYGDHDRTVREIKRIDRLKAES